MSHASAYPQQWYSGRGFPPCPRTPLCNPPWRVLLPAHAPGQTLYEALAPGWSSALLLLCSVAPLSDGLSVAAGSGWCSAQRGDAWLGSGSGCETSARCGWMLMLQSTSASSTDVIFQGSVRISPGHDEANVIIQTTPKSLHQADVIAARMVASVEELLHIQWWPKWLEH